MIRRMREADLAAAAELERLYFSMPWSGRQLKESLEAPEYLFLAAEEQGKVVGYAGLLKILDEGNITNIVVEEAYRGRGIGKDLTRALLAEGRREGMHAFTLEVRAGNAPAIALYEKMGFQTVGRRKNYYRELHEDALLMTVEFSAPGETEEKS